MSVFRSRNGSKVKSRGPTIDKEFFANEVFWRPEFWLVVPTFVLQSRTSAWKPISVMSSGTVRSPSPLSSLTTTFIGDTISCQSERPAVNQNDRLSIKTTGCRSKRPAVNQNDRLSIKTTGRRSKRPAVDQNDQLPIKTTGCRSKRPAVNQNNQLSIKMINCQSKRPAVN